MDRDEGRETHERARNAEIELNAGEVQVSGQTGYLRVTYTTRICVRHTRG